MGWFAFFLLLGLGLICLHRNHNILAEFFVPPQHTQAIGRAALMAGIVSIVVSLVFWFRNVQLRPSLSFPLLMLLAGTIAVVYVLSRRWLGSDAGERRSLSWSLRSVWLPALIVLLIIIAALSC